MFFNTMYIHDVKRLEFSQRNLTTETGDINQFKLTIVSEIQGQPALLEIALLSSDSTSIDFDLLDTGHEKPGCQS